MKEAVLRYFESQPNSVKEVLFHLRELILSVSPGMTEEFKWKVPFYYHNGPICYFNVRNDEVIIGFYHGKSLMDEHQILKRENLKQVAHVIIHPKENIPEDYIRDFLFQSIEIDRPGNASNARDK